MLGNVNFYESIKHTFKTDINENELITIKEKFAVGFLAFLLGAPPYMILNNFNTITPDFITFHSYVDSVMLFVPWTILIYTWVYTFAYTPLFILRNKTMVIRTAAAFIALQFFAALIFYLFPTQIHRPLLTGQSDFVSWGLALVYTLDKPTNCFPSLHVANSFFSAFSVYKVNKRIGLFIFPVAVAISVVTMTTKQHYFVDVVSGIFLGYVFYRIFIGGLNIENVPREKISAPDKTGFVVLYFYLFIVIVAFIVFSMGVQIPRSAIFK